MTYVVDYDQTPPADTVSARLEAAFGATWATDLTSASVVWTDLRGRFIAAGDPTQVSWSRGRTLSSGDMARTPQPGSLSVRLDSADGWLTPENPASPYYPNVAPGLPVRWSVFDGSTWHVEFTGFVTDIDPSAVVDGVPDWTQVDLTAADGWSRIAQTGQRLAFRDRVLTDLAAPRDVSLLLDDTSGAPYTEMLEATGLRLYASGSAVDARDAWGVGVWRLDAGGTLDWSSPGAAGVLAEIGRGYTSGSVGASTTSLACDRYGGATQVIAGGGALSTTCMSQNTAAQQVSVARLPVQLLPASAYDPTSVAASGWTISGGGSLAVGGAPSTSTFVASRFSYDPVTGAQTAITDGPAHTLTMSGAVFNSTQVLSPTVSVTAGKQYTAHIRVGVGHIKNFTLQFLNASGTVVGTGGGSDWSQTALPMVAASTGTAPATATSARIMLTGFDGSVTFHAPGIYECVGDAPARWWPAGAPTDLQLFGQWPIVSGGNVVQWLHFRASVPALADGQPHVVAWNKDPGVGGVPTVWVDGVVVSGTWEASTTSAYAFTTPRNQIGAGTGTTAALTVSGPHAPMTVDPAKVTTFLAITGAPRATSKPSQALLTRWTQQYGSPGLWPQPTTVTGTTDVLMGSLLDALGWPRSMRALQTGKSSATLSWARLAWGTDGSEPTPPGDYSSDVTALAETEFGWADVDGAGNLRWLPRRWYDTGSGTAVASLHLTYEDTSDAVTYTTALTQQMGEGDVINQVWVSQGGVGLSVPTTLLEDFDSQARIGIRRQEFTNTAWGSTTDTDAVAAEVLALYGTARLVATGVTVRCYGADDPNLPAMLALNPADVVVVTVPRAPAADMDLSCLVTQVAATTDGLVTEFTLTLSPCPVPALFPLFPGAAVYPAADLYPAGA